MERNILVLSYVKGHGESCKSLQFVSGQQLWIQCDTHTHRQASLVRQVRYRERNTDDVPKEGTAIRLGLVGITA